MGFSTTNHPFWGIPIYGNPPIFLGGTVVTKQVTQDTRAPPRSPEVITLATSSETRWPLSAASLWCCLCHHQDQFVAESLGEFVVLLVDAWIWSRDFSALWYSSRNGESIVRQTKLLTRVQMERYVHSCRFQYIYSYIYICASSFDGNL